MATDIRRPILRAGCMGEAVRDVQILLNNRFGSVFLVIDQVFGEPTRKAVWDFQSRNGLVPSGRVDSDTWERLLS